MHGGTQNSAHMHTPLPPSKYVFLKDHAIFISNLRNKFQDLNTKQTGLKGNGYERAMVLPTDLYQKEYKTLIDELN